MNIPIDWSQLDALSHFNRPQQRAFILRDQLKYLEIPHLDAFIDGISSPEPPSYHKTSTGAVFPPLAQVTVKDTANSYDLGNVRFTDMRIARVHLTYENSAFEMRESEKIPEAEDAFHSVPILLGIAKHILKLFQTKVVKIYERMMGINAVRKRAFELAGEEQVKMMVGKSLDKLEYPAENDTSSLKRSGSSSLLPRHPFVSKRKRLSVDAVPDAVKTATVNNLPDTIKLDLFNAFVKAAFPNFENLMIASWNVVTVYSNTGSEDMELHESISNLLAVLEELDAYFGNEKGHKKRDKKRKDGAAKGQSLPDSHLDLLNHRTANPKKTLATQQKFNTASDGHTSDASQARDKGRLVELSGNNNTADDGIEEDRPPTPMSYKQAPDSRRSSIRSNDTQNFVEDNTTLPRPRHRGDPNANVQEQNTTRRPTPNDNIGSAKQKQHRDVAPHSSRPENRERDLVLSYMQNQNQAAPAPATQARPSPAQNVTPRNSVGALAENTVNDYVSRLAPTSTNTNTSATSTVPTTGNGNGKQHTASAVGTPMSIKQHASTPSSSSSANGKPKAKPRPSPASDTHRERFLNGASDVAGHRDRDREHDRVGNTNANTNAKPQSHASADRTTAHNTNSPTGTGSLQSQNRRYGMFNNLHSHRRSDNHATLDPYSSPTDDGLGALFESDKSDEDEDGEEEEEAVQTNRMAEVLQSNFHDDGNGDFDSNGNLIDAAQGFTKHEAKAEAEGACQDSGAGGAVQAQGQGQGGAKEPSGTGNGTSTSTHNTTPYLGLSKLGAPKNPTVGRAPVANMLGRNAHALAKAGGNVNGGTGIGMDRGGAGHGGGGGERRAR